MSTLNQTTQSFHSNNTTLNDVMMSGDLCLGGDLNIAGNVLTGANPNNFNRAGQGFGVAVGYAPNLSAANGGTSTNSFRLLASGTRLHLNRSPGGAADTAATVATANANTLILPAGAVITRAFATNNGTAVVGGTNYDIGQVADLSNGNNIFDAVVIANLNLGASVGGGQGTAVGAMDFDDTGEGLDTVAVFASLAGAGLAAAASFVNVAVAGGPNSAGDLKVILEYVLI